MPRRDLPAAAAILIVYAFGPLFLERIGTEIHSGGWGCVILRATWYLVCGNPLNDASIAVVAVSLLHDGS